MAKEKTLFFCKECGAESAKWLGQCPSCKAWDSLVEAPRDRKRPVNTAIGIRRNVPVPLGTVSAEDEKASKDKESEGETKTQTIILPPELVHVFFDVERLKWDAQKDP